MIEFVAVVSRNGDPIDPSALRPLTEDHPRGALFRSAEAALRSEREGRRLVLVRCSRPGELHSVGQAWVAFDGIAVASQDGTATTDVSPVVARVLGADDPVAELERTAAGLRGNFMICGSFSDGAFVAAADPLGTYPLFVAELPTVHVVGSNPLLLEAALAAIGNPVRRSATGLGFEAVFGSGALGSTGFEEIRLLPVGHVLEATAGGTARSRPMRFQETLYRPERAAPVLLDQAAQELAENVAALVRAPYPARVADLTGGVDSRVVLAAILANDSEQDVGFFCSGAHPGPDYSTSAYIQDIYGLHEAVGWLPAAALSVEADPVLAMRHLLYRTMGCYSHQFLTGVGSPYDPDLLRLHGGLAGMFRGEHSRTFKGDSAQEAAAHLLLSRSWKIRRQYLTSGFADRLEKEVGSAFLDRCETGHRPAEVLDQWYLENRNRYHFGLTWRVRQLQYASFHPLYSPAAVQAAYAMSAADRSANRVGFELMRRLYEPLTTLPFAEYRWAKRLTAELPDAALYEQIRPFRPTSPIVELVPGRRRTSRPTPHPPGSVVHRQTAGRESAWARQQLRLGRPHWWVPFEQVLPATRQYLNDLSPSSPVWDVFDRSRSLQLVDRPLGPAWTGREIQVSYKLLAAGIWLSGDEAQSAAGEPI